MYNNVLIIVKVIREMYYKAKSYIFESYIFDIRSEGPEQNGVNLDEKISFLWPIFVFITKVLISNFGK